VQLPARIIAAILIVSAFALQASAQAVGTIELRLTQTVDSNGAEAGQTFLGVTTKKTDAGGVSVNPGTPVTLTLAKSPDGSFALRLAGIRLPALSQVLVTSTSITVAGSEAQTAAGRVSSALGRFGGIAQRAASQAGVQPSAAGPRVYLPGGTTLQVAFSIDATRAGGPATPTPSAGSVASASAPVAAAPAARPVAPSATPVQPSAATTTAAGKIYFCTNTEIVDRAQRKYKEYWSDTFTSNALPDDLTEAWQTYLAATYHLTRTPGSINGAQVSGGCGENTVNFVTNWKRQSKQSWDQNTRINQQRVAAGSSGPIEEHTVIETGWMYTGGPVVRAASAMPDNIRQLVDQEANVNALSVCRNEGLKDAYPGMTNFDCTCFAQKLRDYRMAEYTQRGDRMVASQAGGRQVLNPQISQLLQPLGNPQVDFKACAVR
jgi:hypothetical protein